MNSSTLISLIKNVWVKYSVKKSGAFFRGGKKNTSRAYRRTKSNYLLNLLTEQPEQSLAGRLPEMTAGLFFDCCRLGYQANNYDGVNELTPKELP